MDKIGLSFEEVDKILSESMSLDKKADIEAARKSIATVIIKNNDKILKDIKEIISTK